MFQMDSRNEMLLRRQNQQLRQQLRDANITINSLRSEIDILRKQLTQKEGESTHEDDRHKTPPMQMEEHFQGSDEDNQCSQFQSPKGKLHSPLTYSSTLSNRNQLRVGGECEKSWLFELDEDESCTHRRKAINKVLKKSSERRKQEDSIREDSPYKPISTRQIPIPAALFTRDFSTVKSQKVLFRKMSNSRPIFDCFFVTGYGNHQPCISYSYPKGSKHSFDAYLSLMYGQNSLKQPDLSPTNSKGKLISNRQNPFSIYIKDTFVIPIIKPQSRNSDKDFLIVCEVQESILDSQLSGWTFPRYYCFLSQWKFFSEFRRLISQLVDRIHLKKKSYPELTQNIFSKIVEEEVEQSIAFLHQKTTDYNKTLDCCIGGSGLKFSADIPPLQLAYQMVEKYQQWGIVNISIQLRLDQDEQNPMETELLGVMLVYALAQIKLVLYSATKSKISQAILQLLQIMRPLTYVNPVLLAAIRQQHQAYLDAPMALILGLWSEHRRPAKQKIQIFMNKKLNLAGLIQKAKLSVPDGLVINLDTGLAFGGGIQRNLNELSHLINNYRRRLARPRQTYKMLDRMLAGRFDNESRAIWDKLFPFIQHTQAYCYYLQNKEE